MKREIRITDTHERAFGYERGVEYSKYIDFASNVKNYNAHVFDLRGCEIDKDFIDGMFSEVYKMNAEVLDNITFIPKERHNVIMSIVKPKFKHKNKIIKFFGTVGDVILFPFNAMMTPFRKKEKQNIIEKYETALNLKIRKRNELINEAKELIFNIETYNLKFKNNKIKSTCNILHDIVELFKEDDELNISTLKTINLTYVKPFIKLIDKIDKDIDTSLFEKEVSRLNQDLNRMNKLNAIETYEKENLELKEYLEDLITDTKRNKKSVYADILLHLNNKQSIYNELCSVKIDFKIDTDMTYTKIDNNVYKSIHLNIDNKIKYYKTLNDEKNNYIVLFEASEHIVGVKYPSIEYFNKDIKIFSIVKDDDIFNKIKSLMTEENKTNVIKDKIKTLTEKITNAYVLNDDVSTIIEEMNQKLLNINIKGDENNYDIELRQLKDLMNSDLV